MKQVFRSHSIASLDLAPFRIRTSTPDSCQVLKFILLHFFQVPIMSKTVYFLFFLVSPCVHYNFPSFADRSRDHRFRFPLVLELRWERCKHLKIVFQIEGFSVTLWREATSSFLKMLQSRWRRWRAVCVSILEIASKEGAPKPKQERTRFVMKISKIKGFHGKCCFMKRCDKNIRKVKTQTTDLNRTCSNIMRLNWMIICI